MWYLRGKVYRTTNSVSWWEPTEVAYQPQGLTISLELGDITKVPPNTDDAFITAAQLISNDIKFRDIKWIYPGIKTWVYDLDAMKRVFSELASLHWLTGMIASDGEFNSNPRSGGYYTTEIKFYLYPSVVGEKRMYSYTPDAIRSSLAAFTQLYPDPTRAAFIMMEFTDTPAHRNIHAAIENAMNKYGITALRADSRRFNDALWPNVQTYMHGCGLGVAVFERITSERFNPNVALEVGYMHALRKPVIILKDKYLPQLHTDLLDRIYDTFDPQSPEAEITQKIELWLRDKELIPHTKEL
jgi:hypothetical protein